MNLIFNKDEDGNLTIQLKIGIYEKEFSYIEMIKLLREKNVFEESEYRCELTEDQKLRIKAMLLEINTSIEVEHE